MRRLAAIGFALVVGACGGTTDQSTSTATTLLSGFEAVTTTVPVTTSLPATTTLPATTVPATTVPATTVPATTTLPATTSGSGYFPFNSTDPAMRDCLVGIFGQALYAELNARPPSSSEGAAMGPCMAPSRADSGEPAPDLASSGGTSGSGYFPFNSTDPAMRDCLVGIFGQALYAELNARPPSSSEGAAMGPCMAPSGTEGSGAGGAVYQPDSGSTVDCELDAPSAPSIGWVIENDGILDYRVLGHSPGRGIGGAADPRVVQLDDGRYRMYFAQPLEYGVGAAISPDGVNWLVEDPMVLAAGKGGHVSPLRLADGSWRLFSTSSMPNRPGEMAVFSYVSEDGISLTQEDGYRLTEQDFPYGDIGSPFVIREPGGGYRMYLTAVPEGESQGQPGGNTKVWVVSATSTDMVTWNVDPSVVIEDSGGLEWTGMDTMHPWVGINDAGLFEMYSGLGGPATKRISVDGRTFSDPEYLPLIGADYHVEPLPNGESRLYHSSGTMDTGGDIRILRSTEVWWDVEFVIGGFQRTDHSDPDSLIFVLEICVKGSSSTPLEIQLLTGAGPFAIGERDHGLEMSALSVRSQHPPFQSTVALPRGEDSRWFSGGQGVETLLRVSDGVAMKEWMVLALAQGQSE